jgi:hypothetical protein
MADTSKLSVSKALENMRGAEEPKSKATHLDEKIDDLEKEAQRLKAMRRSLGPNEKPGQQVPGEQQNHVRFGSRADI